MMGTFLTPNGSALQSNSTNQGIVWLHSAATLTFDYIEARSGPGPDARKVVSVPGAPAQPLGLSWPIC